MDIRQQEKKRMASSRFGEEKKTRAYQRKEEKSFMKVKKDNLQKGERLTLSRAAREAVKHKKGKPDSSNEEGSIKDKPKQDTDSVGNSSPKSHDSSAMLDEKEVESAEEELNSSGTKELDEDKEGLELLKKLQEDLEEAKRTQDFFSSSAEAVDFFVSETKGEYSESKSVQVTGVVRGDAFIDVLKQDTTEATKNGVSQKQKKEQRLGEKFRLQNFVNEKYKKTTSE
ncbi:MAG: hypothetical protein CMO81_09240 [Waddliaceae bacterium]|nr:hypothetical protein [Waddliaceae bacterium]